ncbi:MAG: glycosyltransferase family 4 protein [Verrucomicrobiota bacterium]
MKIAYIFERYPVPSQTFLRREVASLRAHGLTVNIHSIFGARWFEWLNIPLELVRRPTILLAGWRWLFRYPPNNAENFWSTVLAALFALARVRQIRLEKPDHLHGVWATGPATVAAIWSRVCGLPFSFGAQAYDVYRHGGDAFLTPKLNAATFTHTTTEACAAHLRQRAPKARVVLARRGLVSLPPLRQGPRAPGPVRFLSVGRLVPKKGHLLQLATCVQLHRRGVVFQARIVGAGPLADDLHERIIAEGLAGIVELRGAVAPEEMDSEYAWADVFWHTGIVDWLGDRDGLPNVIPEAFAHSLPVLSSDAGGASEASAALIVPAGNEPELTAVAAQLAGDEALRARLGRAGRQWVEENFLAEKNTALLVEAFTR